MLAEQAGPSDPVGEGPPHLATGVAPLVLDDSVRDPAEPVAGVADAPGEVDVLPGCERLVEAADGVEHLSPEGEVDGGGLRDVALGRLTPPLRAGVDAPALRVGRPTGDRLVLLEDGGEQAGEPVRPWDATGIGEDDHVARRAGHADVPLVGDGDPHTGRLLVILPDDPRMGEADPVETPLRGVDDHDLVEEPPRQLLDGVESIRESGLVFADDDQGDLHDLAG